MKRWPLFFVAIAISAAVYYLSKKPQPETGSRYPLPTEISTFLSRHNCALCHNISQKKLGPSWQAIQKRYANSPDAEAILRESVINGGSGKWGSAVMPPTAEASPEQVDEFVQWLLEFSR